MNVQKDVKGKDALLLAARILLAALFVIFGFAKLTGFHGAVQYMAGDGLPFPALAAVVAVVMELFVGLALVLGVATRLLALLLALYTLATAFIGHHYWTMSGMAAYDNMIHFYKNFSIIGGLLALYVAGPGKYAIDARLGKAP
jgi:putative oxidoreductase